MNHAARLAPNTGELVSKSFDGEVIVINLVTGAYYSTTGTGAFIWDAIERGASRDGIVARLLAGFDVDEAAVTADVDRWLSELADEHLVIASPAEPCAIEAAAGDVAASRQPYAPPVLSAYRDMRDLLALDPPMPVLGEFPVEWEPASGK